MRLGQSAGIRGGPASSANAFIISPSARLIEFASARNERERMGGWGKGCKFTGHSFAGFSFENASRITDENEFPRRGSERTVPNFSHRLTRRHRRSRKSPAITSRCRKRERTTQKSNRHRAGAIAREVLSSFRVAKAA